MGVAYKQDIDDYRESPALKVYSELKKHGACIRYYDPWVQSIRLDGQTIQGEAALTVALLQDADIVLVTTAHTNVDYAFVQKHAKVVFDTKNAMKDVRERSKIEVL